MNVAELKSELLALRESTRKSTAGAIAVALSMKYANVAELAEMYSRLDGGSLGELIEVLRSQLAALTFALGRISEEVAAQTRLAQLNIEVNDGSGNPISG